MHPDRTLNLSGAGLEAVADEATTRRTGSGKPEFDKQAPPLRSKAVSSRARARKIACIQKAVAEGSYEVSAVDLAEKLIDHMLGR